MTTRPAPADGPRHALVRTGRDPITYELHADGRPTVRAVVSGPLLLDGAALQPVDGPGPWSLKPTRRVAPKAWQLTTPDGSLHATCSIAYRRRGGAEVEVVDGPDDLRFDPDDNVVVDTIKAAALADTGRFVLRSGRRVLAHTERGRAGVVERVRARREGVSRPVLVLQVAADATWQPDPVVACALLVFRRHVVPSFRSP